MALEVLEELAKEVGERPRPIVFATFSGGTKACLYKVFQILHGSCAGLENLKVGSVTHHLPTDSCFVQNHMSSLKFWRDALLRRIMHVLLIPFL
jgi:hypothetical protein